MTLRKILISAICCLSISAAKCDEVNYKKDVKLTPDEVATIISKANASLQEDLFTITSKDVCPPSGDKRDYVSMSNYYWPDPKSPNGYPYIYHDGKYNPESRELYTDCNTFAKMTSTIVNLGEAYKLTKNDIYVNRIEDIVDHFFINEETKMNPNLDFAKIIPQAPGVITEGNCFGVLETSSIQFMLKTINEISASDAWSEGVNDGLVAWLEEFQVWLSTSSLGTRERTRGNNHGTHYDAQYLSIVIFLDKKEEAAAHFNEWTLPRINKQIKEDGSQPAELARTKSWNYCIMNLKGWMRLADYADCAGVDLWHYKRGDQVFIKSMVDWFIPYLTCEKDWKWKQIIRGHLDHVEEILYRAAEVYGDKKYIEVAEQLKPIKGGTIR